MNKPLILGECDGCGDDLYDGAVHDCLVGGNEVTATLTSDFDAFVGGDA